MTEQEAMEMLDSFYEMDEMYAAAQIAINALEEVQQYREIGTVEECRASVEKQKAKKPDYDDYHLAGYRCPDCNNVNPWGYKHCKHCGHKLDWSDVE